MKRIIASAVAGLLALAAPSPGRAEISDGTVKVVVLNDQSSAYSDTAGKGSAVAAQLAIDDAGGRAGAALVVLLSADHQQKVDIGAGLARRMLDIDHADAFFDISNSAVSFAVQEVTRAARKVVVHVGSGNADLVGKACSPSAALWLYDTYALARGLARALYDDAHRSWFLLTADYAFGHAMQRDLTATLQQQGGKVAGAVRHPLGLADFSSFLVQAGGTDMQVLALLNAGADTTNAIKQAAEFGLIREGVKLAVPIFTLVNVKAIGNALAQGTTFLAGYYWDHDEPSRAFAKRFAAKHGKPPTHAQAAVYSAVRHYLKAVEATGSDDGVVVMDRMKAMPVEDFMTRGAVLRPDGRLERDMLLVEVKAPKDVRGEWDLMSVRTTVRSADMLRPLAESECPLVAQR